DSYAGALSKGLKHGTQISDGCADVRATAGDDPPTQGHRIRACGNGCVVRGEKPVRAGKQAPPSSRREHCGDPIPRAGADFYLFQFSSREIVTCLKTSRRLRKKKMRQEIARSKRKRTFRGFCSRRR